MNESAAKFRLGGILLNLPGLKFLMTLVRVTAQTILNKSQPGWHTRVYICVSKPMTYSEAGLSLFVGEQIACSQRRFGQARLRKLAAGSRAQASKTASSASSLASPRMSPVMPPSLDRT